MDPLREGGDGSGWKRGGGVENRKQRDMTTLFQNRTHFYCPCFGKYLTAAQQRPYAPTCSFLTCPEGGCLPMVVVMGEAGEAGHAARVVVLEPLEEFA